MRVVVDTNVLISGIFFGGHPYKILKAWRNDAIDLVASPEMLGEYQRVLESISKKYKQIEIEEWTDFLTLHLHISNCPRIKGPICEDPDDDKFIECAIHTHTRFIVSGDHHLLDVNGFKKLQILKPKAFVDKYIKG